ncbi:MAG: SRPBCC family protein, partial [Solirubrobacteraceae bacterium]
VATRAIDIAAPASAVWPWLAQMGPSPRGGAYTYDWIENLLGLDMHSADTILPEFQNPQVGDTIGYGRNRMRLERLDPGHVLAWRSEDGNWVWTFVLDERDGHTRLISRNRFRLPRLVDRIGMLPMEPGSLVMERKMLRGIRERAERV